MTRKSILETEAMLDRLAGVLYAALPGHVEPSAFAVARQDAESLRRISMTLHRWHELECNADVQRFIPKRIEGKLCYIVAEESGRPYLVSHDGAKHRYTAIPDRERGALKRLAKIMKRYPSLSSYVQTDPRGCALYILKPGDVPAGQDVGAYYSNGLAVYR